MQTIQAVHKQDTAGADNLALPQGATTKKTPTALLLRWLTDLPIWTMFYDKRKTTGVRTASPGAAEDSAYRKVCQPFEFSGICLFVYLFK